MINIIELILYCETSGASGSGTRDCTAALHRALQLCGVQPPCQYEGDDHEPRVDLSSEFVELTRRIVDFNNKSETNNNPNLRFAPQFHKFGCHVRKYDNCNPRNLRYVPVDHCYEEWREKKKSDMLQLNERRCG